MGASDLFLGQTIPSYRCPWGSRGWGAHCNRHLSVVAWSVLSKTTRRSTNCFGRSAHNCADRRVPLSAQTQSEFKFHHSENGTCMYMPYSHTNSIIGAEQLHRKCGYSDWSTPLGLQHWITWRLLPDETQQLYCQSSTTTQLQVQLFTLTNGRHTGVFRISRMFPITERWTTLSHLSTLPQVCTHRMWRATGVGWRRSLKECEVAMLINSPAIWTSLCGGRDMAKLLVTLWRT